MLVTGIKSKPVYTTLKPAPSGLYHLLVGQGSGGEALLRLLREMPAGIEVHVLYETEPFSGRLGAYMGVMVDAEVPGELPSIEEVFV